METQTKPTVTIEANINAPAEKVWKYWTDTDAITKWSTPSPEWHTSKADHDLKPGGAFSYRMEAKDGSFGFDFGGVFDIVSPNQQLDYTIGDGRKVTTSFTEEGGKTHLVQTFEAEDQNPLEMQRGGWQAILDSFKNFVEAQN